MYLISIYIGTTIFSFLTKMKISSFINNDLNKRGYIINEKILNEYIKKNYRKSELILDHVIPFIFIYNVFEMLKSIVSFCLFKDELYQAYEEIGAIEVKEINDHILVNSKDETMNKSDEKNPIKKIITLNDINKISIDTKNTNINISTKENCYPIALFTDDILAQKENDQLKLSPLYYPLKNVSIPITIGKFKINISPQKISEIRTSNISLVLSPQQNYHLMIKNIIGDININDLETPFLNIKLENGNINLNDVDILYGKIITKRGNINLDIYRSKINYHLYIINKRRSVIHKNLEKSSPQLENKRCFLGLETKYGNIKVKFYGPKH